MFALKKSMQLALVITMMLCSSSAFASKISALDKARSLIEYNEEMILLFAYPTAEYIRCEFNSANDTYSGFKVRYTFYWKNDVGEENNVVIDFHFDDNTKLAAIEPISQSNVIPPFFSSDLLPIFKVGILDRLLKDTSYTKAKIQQLLLNSEEAKSILTVILRSKQR
ncbi:hypothetical protein GCAAIG_08360 [Candidatus Electronema halotolerans]